MKKAQITIILALCVVSLLVTICSLGLLYIVLTVSKYDNLVEKANGLQPPDMSGFVNYMTHFETQIGDIMATKGVLAKDPDTQAVFLLSINRLLDRPGVVPEEIRGRELNEVITSVSCFLEQEAGQKFRLEKILPQTGEKQGKQGAIAGDVLVFPAPASLAAHAIPLRTEPIKKGEPVWMNLSDGDDEPDLRLGIVVRVEKHRLEIYFNDYLPPFFAKGAPIVDKEGRLVALTLLSDKAFHFGGIASRVSWIRKFPQQ